MKPCPRCGTANEDTGAACTACGAPFVAGPNPMKQTMLGVAGPTPRGLAPAPAPPATGVPVSTMQSAYAPTEAVPAYPGSLQSGPSTPRGMAPPAAAPAQHGYAPPATANALKQTMLGVAPASVVPSPAAPAAPPIQPAGAPGGKLPQLAGTMLGMAGPPAAPVQPAPPAGGKLPQLAGTMLGMAGPPAAPVQPAPPAGGKLPQLAGTMLGMAGPPAAPTPAPDPGWSAQAHDPAPAQAQAAAAAARMGATQVLHSAPAGPTAPTPAFGATQVLHGAGPASVVNAPVPTTGSPGQAHPGWGNPGVGGAPPWPGAPPEALTTLPSTGVTGVPTAGAPVSQVPKSTMLGVAVPGIAPLNPGVPKEGPPTAPPRPAAPVAPIQVPTVKAGIPKGALVLMAVAGALTLTAVVVALLWQAPRPIYAAPVLGKSGAEVLELSCENCPDGTRVSSGAGSATFEASKARLPLERPLIVGENKIDVSIERPGMGRDEKLALVVPIAFRVRGDLTALREEPPRLKVVVEAVRGTGVVIDGQAVPLDSGGRAERTIDVSKDLRGESDKVESLSRTIPYTVQPPNAPAQSGSVSLRVGVVPLRIDAPGPSIIVEDEHFMLTGRTLKRGEVKVAASHITVAPDGRFSQLMNVSSEGETTITIRADADNHAPRTALVKVKRVANLEKEAAAFTQNATDEYSRFGTDADSKPGLAVVVRGRILESRVDNHTTLALAEVSKGCNEEPCVARLVLGRTLELAKGDVIRAFGNVQRAVEGPRSGQRIPEVAVEFMLKGAAP